MVDVRALTLGPVARGEVTASEGGKGRAVREASPSPGESARASSSSAGDGRVDARAGSPVARHGTARSSREAGLSMAPSTVAFEAVGANDDGGSWYVCVTHMPSRDANVLGALGLALADRLAEAAAPAGGRSAAEALAILHAAREGLAIDALARDVGLSHSGAVRLADRLAGAGLLERRPGADQRSRSLRLTPAGHRAARAVLVRRQAAMESVLALLTGVQQRRLADLAAAALAQLATAPEAERRICRLCDREACGRARGRCPVAARTRG